MIQTRVLPLLGIIANIHCEMSTLDLEITPLQSHGNAFLIVFDDSTLAESSYGVC